MPDLIGRLDKGTADVMVSYNPELEWQTGFLRIADRRRDTRIRNGNDNVRVDMAFAGEFDADPFARFVNACPFDDAVGTCEIDVLEDAEPAAALVKRQHAAQPARPDDDDLPRLDVPLELGADDVERAGLRRQNQRLAEASENQRSDPERIAHADDPVLRE